MKGKGIANFASAASIGDRCESCGTYGDLVKLGLYRTNDPIIGECARTHWAAGDGAPLLPRAIYEATGFQPPFDDLPSAEEFAKRHGARLCPSERTI